MKTENVKPNIRGPIKTSDMIKVFTKLATSMNNAASAIISTFRVFGEFEQSLKELDQGIKRNS